MVKHPSSPGRFERKSPKIRDVICASNPPIDDGLLYVRIFPAHFREQPRTREVPVSNDSQTRNVQDFGGLLDGKTSKEAQFDNLTFSRMNRRQSRQGFVECQYLCALCRRNNCRSI